MTAIELSLLTIYMEVQEARSDDALKARLQYALQNMAAAINDLYAQQPAQPQPQPQQQPLPMAAPTDQTATAPTQ